MANRRDEKEADSSEESHMRKANKEKMVKTEEKLTELGWWQKILYIIYFVGFFLVLTFLLLKLWPYAALVGKTAPVWHVWKFKLTISEEARYIMIVAIMGALGGLAFSARSFAYYIGVNKFKISYTCWYILRPVIGSILAIIFYFAFRAAFFSLSASTEDLNAFGIAALGGIVGLFSRETIDKLDELFKRILPTEKEGNE